MKLTDIIEAVIDRTGQFIFSQDYSEALNCTNFNYDRFWKLVLRQLTEYQQYLPLTKKFNISAVDSGKYTFTSDPPEWISSVKPVGVTKSIVAIHLFKPTAASLGPRKFLWDYRNPDLYLTEYGNFDITAHYNYPYTITTGDNNAVVEVDIPDLSHDELFLDLVEANFLISIGRSRRAFVASEVPITSDADSLVEEGKALLEKATQELYDAGVWYLSHGV